jgi:uncharacterized membrane protein
MFTFLYPILEQIIVSGESVDPYIKGAEQLNEKELPSLRKIVQKLNTPEKVKANLKRQLIYFGQLLRNNKIKEMIIAGGKTRLEEAVVKVKLGEEGIVREAASETLVTPFIRTVQIVVLKPNGKIEFRESVNTSKPKDRFGRRGSSRRR